MVFRSNDDLRIGDFIAVISDRKITLHRITRLAFSSLTVKASPRRIKFDRFTWLERTAKQPQRRAYKPSEHELLTLRAEMQCAALLKEARYMNQQVATIIRNASHLPMETKLKTLRAVIMYLGRTLKRTNALHSNVEIRPLDQRAGCQGDDQSV